MNIRVLPDDLINQIAAGEVVERPASVVKELVENALDAGADQIVIDVADGGRTMISVVDNGRGMTRDDLGKSILRHATSKLAGDDLLNITYMGFRGEALPSIASVSDMTIDTCRDGVGLSMDCKTGEIRPSPWESGTRVRVANLFGKTPARLKFLRSDRAEMMSIVDVVKRLALSRPDVGFILNNKWRFPKDQLLSDRIVAVMGEDVRGRMIEIGQCAERRVQSAIDENNNVSGEARSLTALCTLHSAHLKLQGFISEPTLRRASSVDQYLFVNGRPVKDKVLVGALRAAYMDVMSSREFPLCALYLTLSPREVDVNVSPAKTEVHFLEPARVRAFIIRTLRDALAQKLTVNNEQLTINIAQSAVPMAGIFEKYNENTSSSAALFVREPARMFENQNPNFPRADAPTVNCSLLTVNCPLGRVIGQIGNKYIIAENASGLVIVDQHAAHERIVYEKLRAREIKRQVLLSPIVVTLRPEEVASIMEVADELEACGLKLSEFGDGAIAIYEKPADWDMDWGAILKSVADEVRAGGHSSNLSERLHLKLANYACHHSVRAGQKLDPAQMDALLRDVENTERAGQCNHGRPVYRIIKLSELDGWFERI